MATARATEFSRDTIPHSDTSQLCHTINYLTTLNTEINILKSQSSEYKAFCPLLINGVRVNVLIDSGNLTTNVISLKFAEKLGITRDSILPIPGFTSLPTAKNHSSLTVLGRPSKRLTLTFPSTIRTFPFQTIIVDGLAMPCNIGGQFLTTHGIDQLHTKGVLQYRHTNIPLYSHRQIHGISAVPFLHSAERNNLSTPVHLAHARLHIPARSIVRAEIIVPAILKQQLEPGLALLTRSNDIISRTQLLTPKHSLVHVADNGKTYTTFLNPTNTPISLHQPFPFGSIQPACHPSQQQHFPWV